MRFLFPCLAIVAMAATASAAVVATTMHSTDVNGFNSQIAVGDALSGLIATELAGDTGWHPANTDPDDQLKALTDDGGMRATGFTGLLNDFPGTGNPTKRIQYDLLGPVDIPALQILTGNNGTDGRVFSTTVIQYSTDGGNNYTPLGPDGGYFQSDPSGTVNDAATNGWRATLLRIADNQGPLIPGATNLRFDFYAVHHNDNVMQDPFVGVNPFTGDDDLIANNNEGPITSPLVLEIDVVPEPSTCLLMIAALLGCIAVFRRR